MINMPLLSHSFLPSLLSVFHAPSLLDFLGSWRSFFCRVAEDALVETARKARISCVILFLRSIKDQVLIAKQPHVVITPPTMLLAALVFGYCSITQSYKQPIFPPFGAPNISRYTLYLPFSAIKLADMGGLELPIDASKLEAAD